MLLKLKIGKVELYLPNYLSGKDGRLSLDYKPGWDVVQAVDEKNRLEGG